MDINQLNKAQLVEEAYDFAWNNNRSIEVCYAMAVHAARELGGVEIANSKDGNSSKGFAPTLTFEFDDSSSVYVSYGGVYVIAPNEPY